MKPRQHILQGHKNRMAHVQPPRHIRWRHGKNVGFPPIFLSGLLGLLGIGLEASCVLPPLVDFGFEEVRFVLSDDTLILVFDVVLSVG